MLNLISNIGKDKSFVDDLSIERGIVSMRVAIVPRSAEIKPWFFDLWPLKITSFIDSMVRGVGLLGEGKRGKGEKEKVNELFSFVKVENNTSLFS